MEQRLQVEMHREVLPNFGHLLAFHDLLTIPYPVYSRAKLEALFDLLSRSAQYLFHNAQS